jgi:hypothetical protein
MDVWTLVFTALLVLAALAVCATFASDFRGRARPGGDGGPDRHQLIKARRQMERRRGKVWWKMDELYAEFAKRAGGDPAALLPPAGIIPPEGGDGAGEGKAPTAEEVREAFELFLRKG